MVSLPNYEAGGQQHGYLWTALVWQHSNKETIFDEIDETCTSINLLPVKEFTLKSKQLLLLCLP